MTKYKDLSGLKFTRWLVIRNIPNKNGRKHYECLCDCGIIKVVLAQNLTNNKSRSCGCFQSANMTSFKRTNPILVTARKVWLNNYKDGCSFEKFFEMAQLDCFYCGTKPSNHARAYTGNHPVIRRSPDWAKLCQWTYNGLDRVDASKDHSEDNIVPCCYKCNWAKSNQTVDEFKIWIKRLYENFIK